MKIKDFGLTIVLSLLFLASITGQIVFGLGTYNEERERNGANAISSYSDYLQSGHFVSAVSENMESEFLQMGLFVFLTMCLYQRGSAESKKPKDEETAKDRAEDAADEEYSREQRKKYPIVWWFYENSLSLAFLLIFVISFLLHAWGSHIQVSEQNVWDGKPPITFLQVFAESEFWFESFQNWQSEFFSIAVLGIFSIFLRQKGSPQSKKLRDPIWKTSGD